MKRTTIAQLYQTPNNYKDIDITVCGWVRSLRDSKSLGFIDLNDGSCFKGVQVVFEETILSNYKEIAKQNVGTALCVNRHVQRLLPDESWYHAVCKGCYQLLQTVRLLSWLLISWTRNLCRS